MDIIKTLFKLSYERLEQKIDLLINKSIDTRKIVINDSTSNDNKIKILVDDTYLFNLYSNCLYLMELKTNNKELKEKYNLLGLKLREYNMIYNTDIDLLKTLLNIYGKISNDDKDKDKKYFLFKTIKSMEKYGTCSEEHKTIVALIKNMDKIENIINDILEKPLKINIDRNKIDAQSESIVSSVYPDKKNSINIDKTKYYYLVKKISDKNVRNYLEREFMNRYNDLLPAISKLISSRNMYANLLGYDTFYRFSSNKSDEDTENLKIMLKDLNDKLDFQLESSLNTIKDLANVKNKLSLSDIIYGLNKFFPDVKIKPIDIFQIAFYQIQKNFNIRFSESKITPLNTDCNPIEIYDSRNKLKGYLFLDLLKNNKNNKNITLIKLTSGYGENLPILYLLGSFTDLDKPICTYNDVVTIFRELGHVINNIFVVTPLGVAEDDIELINYMPDFMEYLAYNVNVIKELVKEKNHVKRILKARENEILINLKLKCINVLFDSIIHSSPEFIELNNKVNVSESSIKPTKVLLDLYKRVFTDIFHKLSDIIDCDFNFILPSVINNIINGQQSLIYGNILSNILAFNTYEYISKGKNNKAFNELLENKNYSYKKNLINFIMTINEDYYKYFLSNCLNIKDLSLDNYFDEGTTEHQNETVEEIN
jgi:Zn-dependent oligopeptidase